MQLVLVVAAAAVGLAPQQQQGVARYNPSFNVSSLTSHDPWPAGGNPRAGPHDHDVTGWPVNPDNMPIGTGRMTALVWGDGTHINTSGVGLLLARDDAYTELNQLVKLGRLRVQLQPDPFLNASAYNQTLDLETGEVLIAVTSKSGDHTASLRVAPSVDPGVDAVTVELLQSSRPVRVSVRLELWRYNGSFPVFPAQETNKAFPTFVTGDCLNASQKKMRADSVDTRDADLLFSYRNRDSPVWRHTLETQSVMSAMPRDTPDPLLHRQFGALVQGGGDIGWVTAPVPCLPHCCGSSGNQCGSRVLQTNATARSNVRVAINTHTNQTATADEWKAQILAAAHSAKSASATQAAAAHTTRQEKMKAFWSRSYVTVGSAPVPAGVDGNYTAHPHYIGPQPPTTTFTCSSADTCIAEAASECTRLGSKCMSFALDPAWSKLQAELFTSGLSAAQPNPAWTLWVKNATTAAAASAASSPPQRSPAPFLLNQNYVLFRYLQLIQGNGSTAIHFNGGIIDWGATGNPGTPSNVHDHGSPDYRQWGAGFWFQNVRMAYYPNLQDNDADLLVGLFKHYVVNTMEVMRARCKSWWGHAGLFFSETSYWWGSYRPEDYGCDRHGVPDVENPYMWHHIEGGIELAQLMVRHWHFTQDEEVLTKYTLPWTSEVLTFYDLHYPRNPNGTLLMLNAKSCESYNNCTNPAPQIAGLKMVVQGMLHSIPEALLGEARVAFLRNFSTQIPEIPLMESCQQEASGCGTRCGRCSSSATRAPAGTVQIAPCLLNLTTVADAAHAVGGFPTKAHTVNHEAVET